MFLVARRRAAATGNCIGWSAGECLHLEGTPECTRWVEARKGELYAGKAKQIVALLRRRLDETPKTEA